MAEVNFIPENESTDSVKGLRKAVNEGFAVVMTITKALEKSTIDLRNDSELLKKSAIQTGEVVDANSNALRQSVEEHLQAQNGVIAELVDRIKLLENISPVVVMVDPRKVVVENEFCRVIPNEGD